MKKISALISVWAILGMISPFIATCQESESQKKALAIIGDFWHPVAPIYRAIVEKIEDKGYHADIILDYNVPFDRLSQYDLIVLSRYSVDDFLQLKEKEKDPRRYSWISPSQEEAIESYVENGGNLFLHHDGIGYYPDGGGISRLAKAYFVSHPPVTSIRVEPVGNYAGLNAGIEPFTIKDEEFVLKIDTTSTHIFMQSYSEEHGYFYQGWAHDYGNGKVVVFVPGHDRYALFAPMVQQSISNILDSFSH